VQPDKPPPVEDGLACTGQSLTNVRTSASTKPILSRVIAGHPLHPMMIHFSPVAALIGLEATDAAYL
jgi:hypothetical protein